VCVEVLGRGEDADRHLQAFAMTMLYSIDPSLAIGEMERLAGGACHALLVGAMVENVMSDRERFAHAFVTRLRAMVEELCGERFLDPDEVAAFVASVDRGKDR
jgi:hypothetical protein